MSGADPSARSPGLPPCLPAPRGSSRPGHGVTPKRPSVARRPPTLSRLDNAAGQVRPSDLAALSTHGHPETTQAYPACSYGRTTPRPPPACTLHPPHPSCWAPAPAPHTGMHAPTPMLGRHRPTTPSAACTPHPHDRPLPPPPAAGRPLGQLPHRSRHVASTHPRLLQTGGGGGGPGIPGPPGASVCPPTARPPPPCTGPPALLPSWAQLPFRAPPPISGGQGQGSLPLRPLRCREAGLAAGKGPHASGRHTPFVPEQAPSEWALPGWAAFLSFPLTLVKKKTKLCLAFCP